MIEIGKIEAITIQNHAPSSGTSIKHKFRGGIRAVKGSVIYHLSIGFIE